MHTESLDIAGMLSQLPPEVNVEEHVRAVVMGGAVSSSSGGTTAAGAPPGPGQGRMSMLGGPGFGVAQPQYMQGGGQLGMPMGPGGYSAAGLKGGWGV